MSPLGAWELEAQKAKGFPLKRVSPSAKPRWAQIKRASWLKSVWKLLRVHKPQIVQLFSPPFVFCLTGFQSKDLTESCYALFKRKFSQSLNQFRLQSRLGSTHAGENHSSVLPLRICSLDVLLIVKTPLKEEKNQEKQLQSFHRRSKKEKLSSPVFPQFLRVFVCLSVGLRSSLMPVCSFPADLTSL